MATDPAGVDIVKLLKQVEHILSAREKQYLVDIGRRDADLASANQQVENLHCRLKQAECDCSTLQHELQKLAEIQSRELANHNRQLEELQRKHTELLQTHNDAVARHARRYDKVKKDRDHLSADLDRRKKDLEQERQANQTLERRVEAAAAKERSLSETIKSLTARKKSLQDRCSTLEETAAKYQTHLEVANKRIDDMKQDHTKRIQDLEVRLKSARAASKKSLDEMQAALEKQQKVTQMVTEENLSYRRQLADRCDRHKRLEVRNESLQDEVELLQKQLKTSQLDCNQHRERVAQLEAGLARRDKIIKSLEATEKVNCSIELNAVRDELAQTKHKLSQSVGSEAQLRKQLNTTESRHCACSAANTKLGEDLKVALAEVTQYQHICLDSQRREAQLAEQIKQADCLAEQRVKSRLDELIIRIAEQQSECLRHRRALAIAEQRCRDLAASKEAVQGLLKVAERERDDLLQTLREFLESEERRNNNGNIHKPPPPGNTLDSFHRLPPVIHHPMEQTRTTGGVSNAEQSLNTFRYSLGPESAMLRCADSADPSTKPATSYVDGPRLTAGHKPSDGSVVSQLVSELADALIPSQSKKTTSVTSTTSLSATQHQNSHKLTSALQTESARLTSAASEPSPQAAASASQFVNDFLQRNSIETDVSRLLDNVTWSDLK